MRQVGWLGGRRWWAGGAAGLVAAAVWFGLRPPITLEAREIRCWQSTTGDERGQLHLAVRVVVTNHGRERRIQGGLFQLAAPGGWRPPAAATAQAGYAHSNALLPNLPYLVSRRVQRGQQLDGWLRFENVIEAGGLTNRDLTAQLARTRLRLRYGNRWRHRTVDLQAEADHLARTTPRPSTLKPGAVVLQIETGLCALAVDRWLERWSADCAAAQGAVVLLAGAESFLDQPALTALGRLHGENEWEAYAQVAQTDPARGPWGYRTYSPPPGGPGREPVPLLLRSEAAATIPFLPRDRRTSTLQVWLQSPDAAVRLAAVEGVDRTLPGDVTGLVVGAVGDSAADVRLAATGRLRSLVAPGQPVPAEVVAALRKAAGDPDREVRRAAFQAALSLRQAAALAPPALASIKSDRDADRDVCQVLGAARYRPAVPRLLEIARRAPAYEADSAAEALAQIGDRRAIPVLREMLAEGRPVQGAAYALACFHDPSDVARLITAFKLFDDQSSQADVLAGLGELGGPAALAFCVRAAQTTLRGPHGELDAREAAIRVLRRFADPQAVAVLERIARDQRGSDGAVASLAANRHPSADQALRRIANDPAAGGYLAARQTLGLRP